MRPEYWSKSHLREMPASVCLELLCQQKVGRIAFTDDRGPVVLPVNHAVDAGTILIATSPFGMLARFASKGEVSFEVDQADDQTESGWSVLLRGTVRAVPYDELLTYADHAPEPWAEGTRTLVLRVSPWEMTGRRLIPA